MGATPGLAELLADLAGDDDARAEAAVPRLPAYGREAFRALQRLLRSSRTDTRWWALRALAAWPAADEVTRELVAALDDGSDEVRRCATLALVHHPDPQAVPALIRVLSGPDVMSAGLAADALAQIGAQALPALVELLQVGRQSARHQAVRALAHIKDPRAIPVLMKMLEQDSALMQYWAEHGLDQLGLGMVYIQPE